MAQNLVGNSSLHQLIRLDVHQIKPLKKIDYYIRKNAHIMFLDEPLIFKMLIYRYCYIFT